MESTMASSNSKPTVTFFGATGGCVLAALVRSLKADIHVVALVRSASKLTKLLESHKVPQISINTNLTIVEGDVRDVAAVKRALVNPSTGKVSNIIISGIGSVPKFNLPNLLHPVVALDATICEDAINTILASLSQLQPSPEDRPMIVVVSTTGITKGKRDVPVGYRLLYHWLLAGPHMDKAKMEQAIHSASTQSTRGYVIVRPTLLIDGTNKGSQALKVGWEYWEKNNQVPGPALGYTISRDDVGAWIFDTLVGNGEQRDKWLGRLVTLTA